MRNMNAMSLYAKFCTLFASESFESVQYESLCATNVKNACPQQCIEIMQAPNRIEYILLLCIKWELTSEYQQ